MVEFALAADINGEPPSVMVADCTNDTPAFHVSKNVEMALTPPVMENQESYVKVVLELARRRGVDLVIPLSDLDLEILSANKEKFLSKGVTVLVSDSETIQRCMDKKIGYKFCRAHGIPVPNSFFSLEEFDGRFPVIKKPIRGSGSADTSEITKQAELSAFKEGVDMLQTLVDGVEYGVDILNDLDGQFVSVCVKRKILMRAGETDKSTVVQHPEIEKLSLQVGGALRHVGNLDLDVMEAPTGELFCLDLNPRFGGGYPATHLAGMNYLQAAIGLVAGINVTLPERAREVTVMKGISLHVMEATL
jgi:carbamoyl-phosphate synthase large subunit